MNVNQKQSIGNQRHLARVDEDVVLCLISAQNTLQTPRDVYGYAHFQVNIFNLLIIYLGLY